MFHPPTPGRASRRDDASAAARGVATRAHRACGDAAACIVVVIARVVDAVGGCASARDDEPPSSIRLGAFGALPRDPRARVSGRRDRDGLPPPSRPSPRPSPPASRHTAAARNPRPRTLESPHLKNPPKEHVRALPRGAGVPGRVRQLRRKGGPRAVLAMPQRALLLAEVPEGVLAVPQGVVQAERLRGSRGEDAAEVRAIPAEAREAGGPERRCDARAIPNDPSRATIRSRSSRPRTHVASFHFISS